MSAVTQPAGVVDVTSSAPHVTVDTVPAVLWRRAAARVADVLTVFFLLFALVVVQALWFMDDLSDSVQPGPWGRAFVSTVTFVVLSCVYEVVFLRFNDGQTPGKDYFDVRVVRVSDGGTPTVVQAFVRWLLPGLAWLATPVWLAAIALGVQGIPTLLDPGRRGLHDRLAGTTTVHFHFEPHDDGGDGSVEDQDEHEAGRTPTLMDTLIGRKHAARFRPRPSGTQRSERAER